MFKVNYYVLCLFTPKKQLTLSSDILRINTYAKQKNTPNNDQTHVNNRIDCNWF